MVIYICIKFQENISNSFQVTQLTQIYYGNHYFLSSKGHNSKRRLTRVTVLVFCTSSHDDLHLCEVSSKYMEWFSTIISGTVFNLQSRHEYIVEMAIFKIYYVQRAATPKRRLTRVTIFCSAYCLMVLYTCEKFHQNI